MIDYKYSKNINLPRDIVLITGNQVEYNLRKKIMRQIIIYHFIHYLNVLNYI